MAELVQVQESGGEASRVMTETVPQMERRHAAELDELMKANKELIKAAKKSEKARAEAQATQRVFDLKAEHREQMEDLLEYIGTCQRWQ